jgi:dolichol-phosphate mannosyltransferase
MLILLLVVQLLALALVCARLARGRHRLPEAEPDVTGARAADTTVSVVVPSRNEAARIAPCLDGLRAQERPLVEVIVVDGHSTDATPALVRAAAALDPRIRLMEEPPRPAGRVGRPWAIAAGCTAARGEWVLVVDADTAPKPGMVAGAVASARRFGLDAVSFAPRIVAPSAGARWLQPSLLTTLVYRFGPPNDGAPAERVMANGQCMLMRRDVLERAGGYGVADDSYCDDIRVARQLASSGARVGFLDGPRLLDVTMYPTARETWRAWPPSLHMRDATRMRWRWLDALVLLFAQALPIPLLLVLAIAGARLDAPRSVVAGLVAVNGALLVVRLLLAVATAHSFMRRGIPYWLAPLADPLTVPRVIWAMIAPPREWRGASAQRSPP